MKENKTEKYTFGPDEKATLEILGSFESEFEQIQTQKQKQNQNQNKDQENAKLRLVKYYESFKISKSEISGIFLAEQQDADGNISYHLYFQSPSNEILSVDHEGNVKMKPQWEQVIGYIDFEKCMYINDRQEGRLKGISEKTEPEEIQERLQNIKVQKQDEQKEEHESSQQEEEKEQDEEEEKLEEQIEKDLSGENQEDLGISYYRQIKDANFEEQIGMNLKGYQEIGLAYSKTKNAFIFVGKKDGHYQQVEGFEQAQPTYKTVMSIDEKGENVEKEVPHAIMETSNPEKGVSITIGQYGYIEVGTVERTSCNKLIKRQVREQGQGIEGQEEAEITREFATEGKYYADEIVHKREILEREYDVTETDIEELKDLDIEELIEEEADRVKISKEGFKRYVKEASGKTLKEKISNAQDEIIEEYMGRGRPRSN